MYRWHRLPAEGCLEQHKAIVAPEHLLAKEEGRHAERAAFGGFREQAVVPRARLRGGEVTLEGNLSSPSRPARPAITPSSIATPSTKISCCSSRQHGTSAPCPSAARQASASLSGSTRNATGSRNGMP